MGHARGLALVCLAFAVLLYGGAVAGALFGGATAPGDVGALSTLLILLAFGGLAFLLEPTRPAPARPIT